jgi:hypothetical protein
MLSLQSVPASFGYFIFGRSDGIVDGIASTALLEFLWRRQWLSASIATYRHQAKPAVGIPDGIVSDVLLIFPLHQRVTKPGDSPKNKCYLSIRCTRRQKSIVSGSLMDS